MSNETKQQSALSTSCQVAKPDIDATADKNTCPRCGHHNEPNVMFCEECGEALMQKTPCPYCGTPMYGKHNICEFCGEWLLEGHCKYCEATIEVGQLFCGDCGNLLKSLKCPKCGTSSCFEICLNCGMPLTSTAQEVLTRQPAILPNVCPPPSDHPQIAGVPSAVNPASTDESDEIAALKAYKEKVATQSFKCPAVNGKFRTPNSLFNSAQKNGINKLEQEAEIEGRRQEEERRRKEEKEKHRHAEEQRCRKEAEEWRFKSELMKKALMSRTEGTVYVTSLNSTIIVRNEDGIADDKFWLWINNAKVGYVGYQTGGKVTFPVSFSEGINLVELRFDMASGIGTVASIAITPNNCKYRFGGSHRNHMWVVIVK